MGWLDGYTAFLYGGRLFCCFGICKYALLLYMITTITFCRDERLVLNGCV